MKEQKARIILAEKALDFITAKNGIVGIGTGRAASAFAEAMVAVRHRIDAVVSSSEATRCILRNLGFQVSDLNSVSSLSLYVDGADECEMHTHFLIKGKGGALTREKILAHVADVFVCLIEQEQKQVDRLGETASIPIEVIPMARGCVARSLVALGGVPQYRSGFVTDNGNIILDVQGLNLNNPKEMEQTLKNIVGVVESGIFAIRHADVVLHMQQERAIEHIL